MAFIRCGPGMPGPQRTTIQNPNPSSHKVQTFMHPFIEEHRQQLLDIAEKHGILNVRVFGSMARGDATDASDVDLLVKVSPGTSGFTLGGFQIEVQDLLGCKVDIVTEGGIYHMLKERILDEAISL